MKEKMRKKSLVKFENLLITNLDDILYCICILGQNSSNYSTNLWKQIHKAGESLKAIRTYLNKVRITIEQLPNHTKR